MKNIHRITYPWGETISTVLEWGRYGDGSTALRLVDPNGLPIATVTVCLPDLTPPEGVILVRDYSENEGMADVLERFGIARTESVAEVGDFGARVVAMRLTTEVPS